MSGRTILILRLRWRLFGSAGRGACLTTIERIERVTVRFVVRMFITFVRRNEYFTLFEEFSVISRFVFLHCRYPMKQSVTADYT